VAEQWTFLSNHGRVLLVIADDPDVRLRDVAQSVGITERAVQMIVADLEEGGYLSRERVGRRNHYVVNADRHFRHPHEADHRIGELLELFGIDPKSKSSSTVHRAVGAASAAASAAMVAGADLAGGLPDVPL
jgi:predicted ArsR family transcriptional regulator